MKRLIGAAMILVLGGVLAGCSNSRSSTPGGATTAMNMKTTMQSGVPFDRSFIDAMIPHHRSAIAMAKAAQTEGLASPKLTMLTIDIVDSQQKEIDEMLAWREKWYGSRKLDPNAGKELGMSMAQMGMSHGAGDMKGSDGVADQMFASMMTAHHKGAITMARMALDRAEHPEIQELARAIIAAQEREVKVMAPFAKKTGGHTMTGMSTG